VFNFIPVETVAGTAEHIRKLRRTE